MLETINQPIYRKVFIGLAIVISLVLLYKGYRSLLIGKKKDQFLYVHLRKVDNL